MEYMRYCMTVSYDGTSYKGYQKQPNKKTIQKELEEVLTKINGDEKVTVHASGRTDAGVHAINQKIHFDFDKSVKLDKLQDSLNKMLPDDIFVKKVERVHGNFHARYDVKAKEYIYKINMGEYNPLERNYIYQYNRQLDIIEMERALKYLEGEHNFKSFTKTDEEKDDYVRTIFKATLTRDKYNINHITICLKGSGFLRYMVRNIVGLLIEIGEGKYKSSDVFDILRAEDRTKSGKTAPPNGLYLNDVFY